MTHTEYAHPTASPSRMLIRDPAALEAKLRALEAHCSAGATTAMTTGQHQRLLVVAEFDRTLTTDESTECHGIIGESALMPASFREKMHFMLHGSPDKASEARLRSEPGYWWTDVHAWMIDHGMRRSFVAPAVAASAVAARPGVRSFLGRARERGVPVYVVSAGLGRDQ